MRTIASIILLPLFATAMAAQQSESQKSQTNVNFTDFLVQGKYSLSNEAVITVEADKVLDSLLLRKKDFNQRIKRSAHRQ